MTFRRGFQLVIIMATVSGCDLPTDPEGTFDSVKAGTLKVGFIEDSPWVTRSAAAPQGIEAELVRRLARQLNVKIEWVSGGDSRLMDALQNFELDLIIGGVLESTAWGTHVGLTRPWYREPRAQSRPGIARNHTSTVKHVWAVPPGENEWLLEVERFLQTQSDDIPAMVESFESVAAEGVIHEARESF